MSQDKISWWDKLLTKIVWKVSGMQGLSGKTLEQFEKEQPKQEVPNEPRQDGREIGATYGNT